MPIYSRNRVLAVLNLANKEKGELFSESDERILSIMLGEIGFALENAVLHTELAKHVEQIEERNRALESEIGERAKVEAELRQANEAFQEANRNLTQAYEWMRNNRDQMRKNYFKEEIGFLVDRDGTILSVTERVLEVTRRSRRAARTEKRVLTSSSIEVFRQELRQAWWASPQPSP
jgi:GAF domain-containing protein